MASGLPSSWTCCAALLLCLAMRSGGKSPSKLVFLLPCNGDDSEYYGDSLSPMSINASVGQADKQASKENATITLVASGKWCDSVTAVNEDADTKDADALVLPSFLPDRFSLAMTLLRDKMVLTWFPSTLTAETRKKYTSLIQVSPPSTKLASAISSLLLHNKVTEIAIMSSSHVMHVDVSEQIFRDLMVARSNVTVKLYTKYNEEDGPDENWLKDAKDKVSVILLCVPRKDLQRIFSAAERVEMLTKEFWYLIYEPIVKANSNDLPVKKNQTKLTNIVSLQNPRFDDAKARWLCNDTLTECDSTATAVYDTFLTYAELVRNNCTTNFTCASGLNSHRESTDPLLYDTNGDRQSSYDVALYADGSWAVVGKFEESKYTILNDTIPLFEYDHSACHGKACVKAEDDSLALDISLATVGAALFISLLVIGGLHIRVKYWRRRDRRQWLIAYDDVKFAAQAPPTATKTQSAVRLIHPRKRLVRRMSHKSLALGSLDSLDHAFQGSGTVAIALYKGHLVVVKQRKHPLKQETKFWEDLNSLKELRHDNLNAFVGATADGIHQFVLFAYCSKGSLKEILLKTDISLDWTFKMSFLIDISRGMRYLHKSAVHSHGNLKSSNCVVDGRWVVKLTDYGLLSEVSPPRESDDDAEGGLSQTLSLDVYERQLWTAPELLRKKGEISKGTQKGDVYSFAIVTQEILQRSQPFHLNRLDGGKTAKDIVEAVRAGQQPLTRPLVDRDGSPTSAQEKVVRFLPSCWSEDPRYRPDFLVIKKTLIMINGNKKVNVVDNMINMLESYANNLEDLVSERTEELQLEKLKTENLLLRMLPKPAAERLKVGNPVEPESFDAVSIFFSDIVGFTTIASDSEPIQIVNMLNKLYTRFDEIISQHDVYKVETIGDAYMCVSGLPVRNGKRHSAEIANMALDLLSSVLDFTIDHMPEKRIQLRIGLHTGPCVAGVVGTAMPRYCLFGDTVNTASRMESTGQALRIHMSEPMNNALLELDDGFLTKPRGKIEVKGKGLLATYWLFGKEGYSKPLPTHGDLEESPSIAGSLASGIKSVSPLAAERSYQENTGLSRLDVDSGGGGGGGGTPKQGQRRLSTETFRTDALSVHSAPPRNQAHRAAARFDGYQVALLSQPDMSMFRCGSQSSSGTTSDAESAGGGRDRETEMAESGTDDEDSAVCCRSCSGGSSQSAAAAPGMRRASSASCFARQAALRGLEAEDAAEQLSDGSQSCYQPAAAATAALSSRRARQTRKVKRDINRTTYTKRTISVPALSVLPPSRSKQPEVLGLGALRSRNKVFPAAADVLFTAGTASCMLLESGAHRVFLVRDCELDRMEADA